MMYLTMRKILIILLLLLLVVLQYQLWFTDNGLIRTIKLHHLLNAQQKVNSELKAKNDALVNDVNNLKQGAGVVENTARHDLGMIKKGETFYRIIKSKKT